MKDLEESIRVAREAVEATPKDHPDRSRHLNHLGARLGDRYSRTGAMADLEESIRIIREAVAATPKDHPDRAQWLTSLGNRLADRHSRTRAMADLEEAKQCFNAALNQQEAIISTRISAGRRFLSMLGILQDGHQAFVVAEKTIQLVPLSAPHSLQSTDKQYLLSQAVGLASDAAAIALYAGEGPIRAIQLLETGRGVMASSLQDIHTNLSPLQENYPDLARSFIELRNQLDLPTSQGTFITEESTPITHQAEADQRRKASNQMPLLLEEIRSRPGFERFLLPVSETEMQEAAVKGPIVILNVSVHRCDALIIEQSDIRVLELPHLSRQAIHGRTPDVQSVETLGWLWDAIVSPVLNNLGLYEPPSGSSWPRVWWIPTGPLVWFPFHAAGHHLDRISNTALDRVISSYSSSIKTIIHSRQQQSREAAAEIFKTVVLVAMQDTPEQKQLRYASDEIKAVQAICKSIGLPYIQPTLHKKEVLLALEACSVFHFAGHGGVNVDTPLASLLLLEDWKYDPLTVGSLLDTNLSSKSPFLAYLSACGTGQVRHETSIDESIHLASAFQLAGFRHVMGTLWEVDDELCVHMARLTYEFLRESGISDKSVGGGLHRATRQLRDDWVLQEADSHRATGDSCSARDTEICEDPEPSRPLWVPYVHYGV